MFSWYRKWKTKRLKAERECLLKNRADFPKVAVFEERLVTVEKKIDLLEGKKPLYWSTKSGETK